MQIIKLKSFFLKYEKKSNDKISILSNINLTIEKGEQIAVVGPSGAGKTSLLKSLVFAVRPSSGALFFKNKDPWSLSVRERHRLRSKIFISSQIPNLPPRQKVITAVNAGKLPTMGTISSLIQIFYPRNVESIESALHIFELKDKIFDRVDKLSGGERQRVSLARAIVSDSELWALDEPLVSLDPVIAEKSLKILKEIAKQKNLTFITSLHQIDFALQHFSRIIGIKNGKILFDLSPEFIDRRLIKNLYNTNEQI